MRKFMAYFVGILLTLLCSLSVENLSAQELKVVSFEPLPMDVTARSKVEVDNNDNPCALLRVVVAAEGIEIRGNMGRVGDVINPRASEYVVYLPAGTKTIYVNCPGFMPLTYDIGYKLEGKMAYRITLERPQLAMGPTKPEIKAQFVKITLPTPGSTVLIDGMPQQTSNGVFVDSFALGKHTYYISAPQHYPEEGEFTLTSSGRIDLTVALKPNFGYLEVKSSPSGARVMVDGEEQGTTPCQLKLKSGSHALQLISVGYFVYNQQITIHDGATLPLVATLKANFAQITLKAPHAHSEIWVNDQFKAKGEWSGRLDANTYLVETRTEGYETVSENMEVVAGVPRTVTLQQPNPIYGLLEILSEPFDATIKLDGKVVGTTPWQSNEVLTGKHTIELSKEDYDTYSEQISLTRNTAKSINQTLKKKTAEILSPRTTNTSNTPSSLTTIEDPVKLYTLGKMHHDSKEYTDAIAYFQKAAKLGHSSSQYYLALYYKYGRGVTKDEGEAIKWFRKAADQGSSAAQKALINMGVLEDNSSSGNSNYTSGTTSSSSTSGSTSSSTKKTYKVGDYYNENGKEGVVFWVDETGKHGKIVSMTYSSRGLAWSSDTNEQKLLIGANSETDGAKNMEAVKNRKDWQSKYPAFKWCADLGEGWYLPAKEELELFTLDAAVHDKVNRTLAQHRGERLAKKRARFWYWSSTEWSYKYNGTLCAWGVYMGNGDTSPYDKYHDNSVRAVATF